MKTQFHFQVSTDTDDATGEVLAVYFQVRTGRVRETREYADGKAFADFDVHGQLLGIEFLAPCTVRIVDEIAKAEPVQLRKKTKEFMRNSGPPALIAA